MYSSIIRREPGGRAATIRKTKKNGMNTIAYASVRRRGEGGGERGKDRMGLHCFPWKQGKRGEISTVASSHQTGKGRGQPGRKGGKALTSRILLRIRKKREERRGEEGTVFEKEQDHNGGEGSA